ncbi:hypothetical protein [Cellulomonas biazotea]|uniref:hypothetical protein n=1 Tax=Cellulomonas biazotea TaxID=1709 RepID=UPI0010323E10|nr:hypothetical protein [Cellulomonas biazotea]
MKDPQPSTAEVRRAPRPATIPGVPPAGIAAAQRLVGNRAVTHLLSGLARPSSVPAPVQRTIEDKKKQPVTWANLQAMSTVTSAPRCVQLVIQFWSQTPNPATPVVFTSQKALVTDARAAVADMPAAFAAWLDHDTIKEFRVSLKRLTLTPSATFATALQDRERDLLQAWTTALGPTPSLPAAQHDAKYSTPADLSTRPAAATGRDDGAWHSVSSNLPGVSGKSTGSVNHALAEEAIANRGLRQHDDGTAGQVCATCGHVTDATQFEVDHQQAFSEIRENLLMLARAMALNATLYTDIQKTTPSFARFFQTTGTPGSFGCEVVLTAEAVHVYSNDIGNLMRICRRCNGAWGKSDMDMFAWFRSSPYFGQPFIDANAPPPGPTTIITRTKTGGGWGQAARDWFATHHLPALQQQFVLDAARRFLHKQLTKQSRTGVKALGETDPVKKAALEQKADSLTGRNAAFLGGISADQRYFSGELTGEPTPFAPGSPGIWEQEHEQVATKREKRKKHEATAATTPYQDGYGHGSTNATSSEATHSGDPATLAAYRQGYADGRADYLARFAEGVRLALGVADPATLPALATTVTDPATGDGVRETTLNRIHAVTLGRTAGAARTPPDTSSIPRGTPSTAVLLDDYLQGYTAGMTGAVAPTGSGSTTS